MSDLDCRAVQAHPYESFVERFQSVVIKRAEHPAVITSGVDSLSYSQLWKRACRVSENLAGAGHKRGDLVAISIEKSADYIACLIGVWMAGGAFVPIDPTLPEERVRYIVDQSGLRIVVIKSSNNKLFDSFDVHVLSMDELKSGADAAPVKAGADELAYVIYTSGSTGRPKGVMVPHRGIVNLLLCQIEAFQIKPESRSLFYLSTSFDASISDIGTMLLAGATVSIEKPEAMQPGPAFGALLADRKITHMDIPPAFLRIMDPDAMPDSLKAIVIGGEACAPEVVRKWAAKVRVVNVYGPTEATVCSSLVACDPVWWQRPSIGFPIRGVEYRLLSDQGQPVEKGKPGELYIGGVGLALGYLNNPALTAEKFVTVRNERLYRTGDALVEHQDGQLEFLGRIDRQFKLRGLLIEPEEIEKRLEDHPGVERAVVLKRALRPDTSERIVAFVTPRTDPAVSAPELIQHLSLALPAWMHPRHFEFVEKIPLGHTGKPNFEALFACELHLPEGVSEERLSATEEKLIEAWRKILGIERISPEDDFFDLGGDSFAVLETVVCLETLGVRVTPQVIIGNPILRDLAVAVDARADAADAGAIAGARLRDDVKLDNSWTQSGEKSVPQEMNNVFVTGATGFLASRLLVELLARTMSNFHVLVRANSTAAAFRRVEEAMDSHGHRLTQEERRRIIPVCGRLDEERFGLKQADWRALAGTIDCVVHSAARVHMLETYDELKPTNVFGTQQVARFLLDGRSKRFHYASTLSVFVATSRNTGTVYEHDDLTAECDVYGGYAQSKFAAEVFLRSLAPLSNVMSIYRLGLITGDSITGRSSKDDFLSLFIRGLASLGCAPIAEENVSVDITPVDFGARAMCAIIQKGGAGTFHLANKRGLSLNRLVEAANRAGAAIERVSPDQFLERVQESQVKKLNGMEAAACLALCRCLAKDGSFERFRTMDLFQATDIRFDMTESERILSRQSIKCPEASDALIERYARSALSLSAASQK